MSFHLDNLDHKTSVNCVLYASAFCLAFVIIGSPFLFPAPPKSDAAKSQEMAKSVETPKSDFANIGEYLTQYSNKCVATEENQNRIKDWKAAGEPNAEAFILLQCEADGIDTFVEDHTKVPEPKSKSEPNSKSKP